MREVVEEEEMEVVEGNGVDKGDEGVEGVAGGRWWRRRWWKIAEEVVGVWNDEESVGGDGDIVDVVIVDASVVLMLFIYFFMRSVC